MAKKAGGRAFAQDLGHGEGNVNPAKGQMKRGKAPKARALMTHAATGGGDFNDQVLGASKRARAAAGPDPRPGAGTRGGGTTHGRVGAGGLADQMAGQPSDEIGKLSGDPPARSHHRTGGKAFDVGIKGERFNGPEARAAAAGFRERADETRYSGGVLHGRMSSADPAFYSKKRATERALGRDLTIDEFLADFYVPDDAATAMGTSIFDPVLCELAYRWFCPPGGRVLDPFAGGSVRGVVAGILGRPYVGVELRAEQVFANRVQAETIFEERDPAGQPMPVWIAGDSGAVIAGPHPDLAEPFDFVFSCPPYADLEVYSDDPRDLSTMDYDKFVLAYTTIIVAACGRLARDRFACFVVGDVRGPDGSYRSFPQHTIEAFAAAGLRLYNDAVLVTAVGSLPIRAGRQFTAGRKLGTTHQRILVFVKGDGFKATAAIGPCDFADGAFTDAAEGETANPSTEPASVNQPEERQPPAPPRSQSKAPTPAAPPPVITADPDPSPLESVRLGEDGDSVPIGLKRDDLFEVAGVRGGKVRSCWHLCTEGDRPTGLITAGSRSSPQVNIVAQIAKHLGVPCRVHIPQGELGPEVELARDAGAEIVQHKAGYNTVIVARARADAAATGWREIPFGMECWEAVRATGSQVFQIAALDRLPARLVVPVGSGMSLAGILHGLRAADLFVPVLGVVVGADPTKRLDAYAPAGWREMVELVPAGVDYHKAVDARVGGVLLDPIYEAKCARFLRADDLLWIVGVRQAVAP